ncbi:MAG: hypothetical protein U1F43_29785 [Myxococcota bacterium]
MLDAEIERLGTSAGGAAGVSRLRALLTALDGRDSVLPAALQRRLDQSAGALAKRRLAPRLASESGWVERDGVVWRAHLVCSGSACAVEIEQANLGPAVMLRCAEPLYLGGKRRARGFATPQSLGAGSSADSKNDIPANLAAEPDLRVHLECARGAGPAAAAKLVLDLPVQR